MPTSPLLKSADKRNSPTNDLDKSQDDQSAALKESEKSRLYSIQVEEMEKDNQIENEAKKLDIAMLKITDEEALREIDLFNKTIHKVMLKTRYFYWFVVMLLICIALTLCYISTFESFLQAQDENKKLLSDVQRQHLVFILFWGGFYCDDNSDDHTFRDVTYPYYLLLIIFIMERLAQIWVRDRFGCSEEQMEYFKEIETKVK